MMSLARSFINQKKKTIRIFKLRECIKTKPSVIRKLLRPKAPQMQQCKLIMRNGMIVAVAAAYESLTVMSIIEM